MIYVMMLLSDHKTYKDGMRGTFAHVPISIMNINKCFIYMHIQLKLVHHTHSIHMREVGRVLLMATGGQSRPMELI